ncbi:hypothetical protein C2S52_005347 [Perilla frutescens var. hirtella]|nr:hypothetical protein C2S51_010320 [Perilla frutescens var. frutescens]KAH6794870.1 hypothetical protein C2S52_005347 [Perilla frutescens var. hirtella]
MSAIVCGKRSFFEDLESAGGSPASSSPPAYKKFRYASSGRFAYSPPVQSSPVDQLKALFPHMEIQHLQKALEEAGNDIDSAINWLNELHLESASQETGLPAEEKINIEKNSTPIDAAATPSGEPQLQNNLPADGAAWVDLIVKEMMSATSIDDAKSRAARVLESLEKSISVQTGGKVAEVFHKENMMLKEQIEALLKDNAILKRAVSIQHERQKEYDERNAEAQQLKQLLAQYQEQLRTLEVSNYALTMHLRQAQQSSSIPGHFHPDVF